MTLPARLPIRPFGFLLLAVVATPCAAQSARDEMANDPFFSGAVPPDPALAGTIRLTPEQREAALEYGAVHPNIGIEGSGPSDRKIHGEVGVEVGTGGERAAYGTAVVPLGDTGVAAISVETDRSNYRARRR